MNDRRRRLGALGQVPLLARLDHRYFLNEQGKDARVEALPRKDRRRLKAGGRAIAKQYADVLISISKSGAGYEADKILRQLSIEYTHRYAASGVYNQPASFNYFEPFCDIKLISGSCAPYAIPAREIDNLFGLSDYLDFITDSKSPEFHHKYLYELEDGIVHHYNVAGSISEFTFLSPAGKEFVLSSFSIVRRRGSIHWYIVAGEILSDEEWIEEKSSSEKTITDEQINPRKALFLADVAKQRGSSAAGPPLRLPGAKNAKKTIASGEIEIATMRHLGRCLSIEHENSFLSISDDPDTFSNVRDKYERMTRIFKMSERVAKASAVWALAEAMLRLPQYFSHRLAVPKAAAMAGRVRAPPLGPKATKGDGERFRYVPSIVLVEDEKSAVRQVNVPYYEVEKEGFWRNLEQGQLGRDRYGELIPGKTWIAENIDWRYRSESEKTIYVKSSVAQAKIKREEFLEKMARLSGAEKESQAEGVLYILRCLTMAEEVYKVGWTAGSAEDRARELSAATGVPTAFAVVSSRRHARPAALEAGVHARLAPYRLNDQREFFQVPHIVILDAIEQEIERMAAA